MQVFCGRIPQYYIVISLILLMFCGCGDDEVETVIPFEPNISDEFRFPRGTSTWHLSDKDIAELLESHSPDWSSREDPEEWRKGFHAQLLKQFGERPELLYIIAYDRHSGEKTGKQIIAYQEAMYRLFPSKENEEALEVVKSIPFPEGPVPEEFTIEPDTDVNDAEDKLRKEDPHKYVEIQRERFIKKFGDIPEVHIYMDILLKVLTGQPLTEEDEIARDNALAVLQEIAP